MRTLFMLLVGTVVYWVIRSALKEVGRNEQSSAPPRKKVDATIIEKQDRTDSDDV